MIHPLTEAENEELRALLKARDDAMAAKTAWLDRKMLEHSTLKVGDDMFDLDTGECLGKITKLYRYWSPDAQGRRDNDTSIYCDYEFGRGMNTSCAPGRRFGSKEDYIQSLKNRLARIEARKEALK